MLKQWITTFNIYYIFPGLVSIVVIYLQFYKGHKKVQKTAFQVYTAFSAALVLEYFVIFLWKGSFPGTLSLFQDLILFLAICNVFLMALCQATEGTPEGVRIRDFMNKHFSEGQIIVSVHPNPYVEESKKLREAREKVTTGHRDEIKLARQYFLEATTSALTLMSVQNPGNDIVKQFKEKKELCEQLFMTPEDFTRGVMITPGDIGKISDLLSKLAGILDALKYGRLNSEIQPPKSQ